MTAWTTDDVPALGSELGAADECGTLRWVSVERSALGGAAQATLFVRASADAKEDWPAGILHNSRYALFCLGADHKLALLSSGTGMPRFRKRTVKGLEHAAELVAAYFVLVVGA